MSRTIWAGAAGLGIAALLPGGARAQMPAEAESCVAAGAQAERDFGLPAGLLLAIGQVESGRLDSRTGAVVPWPWTIDVAGQDAVFAAKPEAVARVQTLQAQGVRSIDVGCFQVNLLYHPQAFADLEEAFEPSANARYAASFLAALHQRTGMWQTAVALYHSATPGLGEPYRDRVWRNWNGAVPLGDVHVAAGLPTTDPFAVLVSSLAAAVQVWRPAVAAGRSASAAPPRPGLPRVITP